MDYIKLISGYILMVVGLYVIRSQGVNYSNKKAIGLFVCLAGATLLFFVAWWHIIIALILSSIVAIVSGKKSGVEKEIEKNN